VLKKLQIAFCVLIGIGIVVFFVAMITNVNVVPTVPKWLSPVAWGSFGVMVVCSLGVVVTIALERDGVKPKRVAKEPAAEEGVSETEHATDSESVDAAESEFTEGELPVESESVDTGMPEAPEGAEGEHVEYVAQSETDTLGEAPDQPEIDFEDFK
jgi:hypothetical protein